jgi:phenol hydroxylase P0 protein
MEGKIFDTTRKFVRVIETRRDGMVGFEFAIGEPALFVELMMPATAFNEFCAVNRVTVLAPKAAGASAAEGETQNDWDWGLHQATHQRFKSTE